MVLIMIYKYYCCLMLCSLCLPMQCCLVSCWLVVLCSFLVTYFKLCSCYVHAMFMLPSSSFLSNQVDVVSCCCCCCCWMLMCWWILHIPMHAVSYFFDACALMIGKDMLILSLQLLQRFGRRMVYISFVSFVQGGVFFLLLCLVGVFWT